VSDSIDYYALLELPPEATAEEIEEAYRKQMRAWHPGNVPDGAPREMHDLAAERTRQLIEARRVLLEAAQYPRRDAPTTEPDGGAATRSSEVALPARLPAPAGDEAAEARPAVEGTRAGGGRLIAWLAVAGVLAVGAYALGPAAAAETTGEEFYSYSFGITALIFAALMVAVTLWIAPGIGVRDALRLRAPHAGREALALRPPSSWRFALAAGGGLVVAAFVVASVYDRAFGPFEGDPTIPTSWDGSRLPQFVLNFIVIALVVAVTEELMYRGVGYALLERFGTWIAVAVTGALFALAHGYLDLLPFYLLFGILFGWLRARTRSIYPGILVHGTFNGLVTVGAIAFG
jgi:uncharacterized protein